MVIFFFSLTHCELGLSTLQCFHSLFELFAGEDPPESHKEVQSKEPEKKAGTEGSSARKRKKDKKQVMCAHVCSNQLFAVRLFSLSFSHSRYSLNVLL